MRSVERRVVEQNAPTDAFLKVETQGIEPILERDRKGSPRDVAWLWVAAFANFVSLITGALLITFGLGVAEAMLAVAVGSVGAAAIHGLLSVAGPRFGTSQVVAARHTFGTRGAYGGAFFTLFLAVGWFAVDCVIAAQAIVQLAELAGWRTGSLLNGVALLLVVVLSILVAVYGHQTIAIFEKYGAIVFVLFCAVLAVSLLPKVNWGLSSTLGGADHLAAWVLGTSIVFALVASWFSFASDYSRYLPARLSVRSVAGWIGVGTALSMFLFGALGVLLATIDPKAGGNLLGLISTRAPLVLVVPFLVFVAVGEIWANYLDVYTAGLSALALNVRLKRWTAALTVGLLGGILAYLALFLSNFRDQYTNFLLITYLWVPSWAAVVLVDMFVFKPHRTVVPFRAGAMVAWLIGLAAAIPFVNSSLWQSPLAVNVLHNTDISGYVGALVGAVAYLILGRR